MGPISGHFVVGFYQPNWLTVGLLVTGQEEDDSEEDEAVAWRMFFFEGGGMARWQNHKEILSGSMAVQGIWPDGEKVWKSCLKKAQLTSACK